MASSADELRGKTTTYDPAGIDDASLDDTATEASDVGKDANRAQIRGSSLLLVGRVIGLGLAFLLGIITPRPCAFVKMRF